MLLTIHSKNELKAHCEWTASAMLKDVLKLKIKEELNE